VPRTPVKRPYRSSRRAEQAEETRERILAAARDLFARHGYAATSVQAIAARAGVAVPTVYVVFRTKRDLLSRVIDVALTGDDDDVPVRERPWVLEVKAERDQGRQLDLIARNVRAILDRAGAIHRVIREAAPTDPAIAKLLEQHRRGRLAGQTEFISWVAARGAFRNEVDVKAAGEILWALASPELHDPLTTTLRWSGDTYERWLSNALRAQLLGPSPRARSVRGRSRSGARRARDTKPSRRDPDR
jgi:AcrR family transcriptional regulator